MEKQGEKYVTIYKKTDIMRFICCSYGHMRAAQYPGGACANQYGQSGCSAGWRRFGEKFGTLSMVLYILLGAIGLPVFAMGKGGFSVLAGPTGGYIIGYVFMAFITGWFAEKYPQRKGMLLVGMVTGNLICYIFGTVWFMLVTQTAFWEALMLCVVPFLPGDAVKIVAAMLLSVKINKIITR